MLEYLLQRDIDAPEVKIKKMTKVHKIWSQINESIEFCEGVPDWQPRPRL